MIDRAGGPRRLELARDEINALAGAGPSALADWWPVEGAALINLRNIAESFALVAEANPLGRLPLVHESVRGLVTRARQARGSLSTSRQE